MVTSAVNGMLNLSNNSLGLIMPVMLAMGFRCNPLYHFEFQFQCSAICKSLEYPRNPTLSGKTGHQCLYKMAAASAASYFCFAVSLWLMSLDFVWKGKIFLYGPFRKEIRRIHRFGIIVKL